MAFKSKNPAEMEETVAHPNKSTARNCQQTTPANNNRGRNLDAEMDRVAWLTALRLPEANARVFGNTPRASRPSHRLVEKAIRYQICQKPTRPILKGKKGLSAQTFLMSSNPGRIASKNAFWTSFSSTCQVSALGFSTCPETSVFVATWPVGSFLNRSSTPLTTA